MTAASEKGDDTMNKKMKWIAVLAATVGFGLHAQADSILTTALTVTPGANGNPINVWTVYADGTDSAVTGGNSIPTTGNLLAGGTTGSFQMTWTAEHNYDPINNAGDIGNGWKYNATVDNFGPDTPSDTGIQILTNEAVRMKFILTGLTLGAGQSLELNKLDTVNSTGGRVSFYDASEDTITLLAGGTGSITMPNSDPYLIPLNQVVDDGDEIIMWREVLGSGQYRIRGFEFEVIPEPATLGMVAVFGGGLLLLRRRLML
jgi:hypothetical protein